MSLGVALIAAVTVVLVVGMIGEYGPRWVTAVRDLEDRRLTGYYPPTVVQTAVRGALIAHADLDDEAADRTAALVVDELETNDVVFDGHAWVNLETVWRR